MTATMLPAYKPGYTAGWCTTANRFNLFHLKTTTEHYFIRWDPGTEKGPIGAEVIPWAETAILLGHIYSTAEKTQITEFSSPEQYEPASRVKSRMGRE